jgi:hypothetical protein
LSGTPVEPGGKNVKRKCRDMSDKKRKSDKRTVLLKGEGENQHVLYGESVVSQGANYRGVKMKGDGLLRHEDPEGRHAEHRSIRIARGEWVMGLQVEFDPFPRSGTPFNRSSSDPLDDERIIPVWD